MVAFFLTLVLALGESVAVQSLALVLEAFRLRKVTPGWFLATCRREALTALPLAVATGLVVFMVVLILDHALWPALIISGSIAFAVGAACSARHQHSYLAAHRETRSHHRSRPDHACSYRYRNAARLSNGPPL